MTLAANKTTISTETQNLETLLTNIRSDINTGNYANADEQQQLLEMDGKVVQALEALTGLDFASQGGSVDQ